MAYETWSLSWYTVCVLLGIGFLISGLHNSVELLQRLTSLHGRFHQALILQTDAGRASRPGRGDLLDNVPGYGGLLGRRALLVGYLLGIGQGLTELGRIRARGRRGIEHLDLLQLVYQVGPHGFEPRLIFEQTCRQSLESLFVFLARLLIVGGALNVKRSPGRDTVG